jgi:hypothetical protein
MKGMTISDSPPGGIGAEAVTVSLVPLLLSRRALGVMGDWPVFLILTVTCRKSRRSQLPVAG